jgi:hypothetical protein
LSHGAIIGMVEVEDVRLVEIGEVLAFGWCLLGLDGSRNAPLLFRMRSSSLEHGSAAHILIDGVERTERTFSVCVLLEGVDGFITKKAEEM